MPHHRRRRRLHRRLLLVRARRTVARGLFVRHDDRVEVFVGYLVDLNGRAVLPHDRGPGRAVHHTPAIVFVTTGRSAFEPHHAPRRAERHAVAFRQRLRHRVHGRRTDKSLPVRLLREFSRTRIQRPEHPFPLPDDALGDPLVDDLLEQSVLRGEVLRAVVKLPSRPIRASSSGASPTSRTPSGFVHGDGTAPSREARRRGQPGEAAAHHGDPDRGGGCGGIRSSIHRTRDVANLPKGFDGGYRPTNFGERPARARNTHSQTNRRRS
mmetsp:Transcript_1425/g.5421  ORF Transcript_1425/g.5421 Transcript_1425/m.5421 type:complete len:267 (-) Transcript_1425:35-835(-)